MQIKMVTQNSSNITDYKKKGKVGDLANRIDEVLNWLKEKGIKANTTRYSKYKQHIQNFSADAPLKKGEEKKITLISDFAALYEKSAESIREIYQIVCVYDAFKDENNRDFIDRLQKVVSGKEFYSGEPNDQGRDFLYELVIAAWYKMRGYEIIFDSETQTDVVANKNGTEIYIECKRLKSVNGYEDNFKKGCKQLQKVKDDTAIKLVYIDIYNCLKSTWVPYEYQNIIEIGTYAKELEKSEFYEPNFHTTERVRNQYKDYVDGVVYTTMGTFGLSNIFGIEIEVYSGINLIASPGISNERFELIKKCLGA